MFHLNITGGKKRYNENCMEQIVCHCEGTQYLVYLFHSSSKSLWIHMLVVVPQAAMSSFSWKYVRMWISPGLWKCLWPLPCTSWQCFAYDCAMKVLMGNFNHPNIYRTDSTAGLTLFWRFLECIIFTQVTAEALRRGTHKTSYSPTIRGLLGM